MIRTLLTSFIGLVLGLSFLATGQELELDRQVFDIAKQLRCPVCVAESVADSNAQISIEMRNIIQQQLREGKSEAEIKAFFQASYGDWILLSPPKRGIHLLVWVLPLIVALLGAMSLIFLIRRWVKTSNRAIEVSEQELKRVRDALGKPER